VRRVLFLKKMLTGLECMDINETLTYPQISIILALVRVRYQNKVKGLKLAENALKRVNAF